MTLMTDTPREERFLRLFERLGIRQAHIAGLTALEALVLTTGHRDMAASLTLFSPPVAEPRMLEALEALSSRLLVIHGDRGPMGAPAGHVGQRLQHAMEVTLDGYFAAVWSDIAADRADEVVAALLNFLAAQDQQTGLVPANLPEGDGEVAGISYRIRGAGPPLVLLPLGLALSQWEPLLPLLSERYCTITLGGAHLGFVAILENRGTSRGYQAIFRTLVDEINLAPGERILDVGCGTGVLDRWLARRTAGANPITALDLNPYLLREAESLARREELTRIAFQEGNAEALPFPDASFDVTISTTVMEEGDANRMLAELVRVTRPGGRVAAIVRGPDMPMWVNLPLSAEAKRKAEAPGWGGGKADLGCADSSLYTRFQQAGLVELKFWPQMWVIESGSLSNAPTATQARLSLDEQPEWQAAVVRATQDGTYFIAQPHHCAVGTKR